MTMMAGIVEEIGIKEVNTKFGVKPTYSIKVGGKWIKCGFKNPGVEIGYSVDFDGTVGTYGLETKAVNIVAKSSAPVHVPGAAVPIPAPVKSGTSYNKEEKVFPIPPLHGERALVRRNALERAVETFVAAFGGKPFTMDESSCNVIIALARKFEAYTAGDIDLEEAVAETAEAVAKAAETA